MLSLELFPATKAKVLNGWTLDLYLIKLAVFLHTLQSIYDHQNVNETKYLVISEGQT